PYVTSSNTVAGQAATGAGIGPRDIGYVLGIAKAYTTRVGEGPFPTELADEIGDMIGNRGAEFGTVTGRKRRCGWFDSVLVRQTVITGGIDGIALTELDVLDGFEELELCVAYELDAREIDHLPADSNAQERCDPTSDSLSGWSDATRGAMTRVGKAELIAAVANAGALGFITAHSAGPPEALAKEVRKCRDMTDKPFGVNLTILPSITPIPYDEYREAIIESGITIVE